MIFHLFLFVFYPIVLTFNFFQKSAYSAIINYFSTIFINNFTKLKVFINFPEVSITFYLKDFFQAKTLHFCLILLFFLPLITVLNFSIGKILKTHYLLSCFTFATLKLTKLPRQVCIAVNKTTKSTAKTLLQGDYRLFKPQSNLLHPNSNK